MVRINKIQANDFYKQYEHLGNCGLGVWHFGLLHEENLLSVVSYGTTCLNQNRCFLSGVLLNYKLKLFQLTRGGTKDIAHRNIPSQIIKHSMLEMRKEFGNNIIIAYSDINYNEIGIIYQANNFHYTGLTNPKGQSNYHINGKLMSGWSVRKKYGTRCYTKLSNMGLKVEKIPLNPKHRYIFINSSSVIKKLVTKDLSNVMVDEYPKRNALSINNV